MVQLNYNSYDHDSMGEFQPLPEGTYPVIITDSEMKPTKDGKGSYLQLNMKVQGGDLDGRVVIERLNLMNANETAVEIANKTLGDICRVVFGGEAMIQDSQELHGRPFRIYVTIQPGREGYGPSNNIKGYFDINGIKAADIRKAGQGGQPGQPPVQGGQPPMPPQQATGPAVGGPAGQQMAPGQYAPNAQPVQQGQPQMPPQPQPVVQHQQQPPQQPQAGYQGRDGEVYQDPTNVSGQTPPSQPTNNAPAAPQAATTSGAGATAAPGSAQGPGASQTGTATPGAQPAQPAAQQANPGQAPWQQG